MQQIVSLFTKLVQIDSISGKENDFAEYITYWLQSNKFSYKIDSVGNIFADNQIKGRPILLCAHMDTVQPGEKIKPIVQKGIIKSKGKTILGADNKAAIAAIIQAISLNNNRHLELLFTVKEETGGGIEFFPFEWIKSKQALIFDSANPLGGIILHSPFIINFHVTIKGKAIHASKPKEGLNALTYALQFINQIKTGSLDKDKTTINIGKISGGNGVNIVPELVIYSGEIRSYNKDLFQKHLDKIKTIHTPHSKQPITINFTTDGYCPGYTHKKTDKFVEAINQLYKSVGLKTHYYYQSGISDANILNTKGFQTINLTDGTKKPHTTQEEIAVKDLSMLFKIIISCIKNL